MRLFSTGMLAILMGCGSNWTCPKKSQVDGVCRFPNPFKTTPHWQDCDGDGWGDGEPSCVDSSGAPVLDCENGDGGWVQNGLDCDDSAPDSGARIGMACPDDYAVMPDLAYSVLSLGAREYMFWRGQPEHHLRAQEICQNWWTNPLRIATEEFNLEAGDDRGGLLSLSSAERAGFSSGVQLFMGGQGMPVGDTYDIWVDVRLRDPSAAEPVWVWGEIPEEEEVVRPEDWCSGPPDPVDIFPVFTESAEQGESALQMFGSVRLVMRHVMGSPQHSCLVAPNQALVCPDGGCIAYDFVCERKAFQSNCQQSADVFNPSCLNILALSDLTCDATTEQ